MPKLFSNTNKKFLSQIDKPERELNRFICENWKNLFPNLTFITSEFPIKGNVRSLGSNGRMDIVAYNPVTKKFVIFELKKDYDKNITDQAADYRDYVQDNFSEIYLHSTQKYDVELPKFIELNQNNVEIILIAKRFSLTQIERVKRNKENTITIIKYYWFEDDLIFIDYINNDPDDVKIESIDSKKVRLVKEIINQDPDLYEIDRFFNLKQDSKDVFIMLYDWLKTLGEVTVKPQQVLIKLIFDKHSFSGIGYAGKVASRQILQINTNINLTDVEGLLVEDRVREGQKKKGSLASERYEVRIRNRQEMEKMIEVLKSRI
jgi:hypothetical protein